LYAKSFIMSDTSHIWNLWHGCHKISEGCLNCYVYRGDGLHGIDSSVVRKTERFDLPIWRRKNGAYKVPSGTELWTCFTSDFFIEEADEWRKEAWKMIRTRSDLTFFIVTKRVSRILQCLPPNWGDGYDNVTIYSTVESQRQAELRLPVFKDLPLKHKGIICEPLLDEISLNEWLGDWVEQVIVGGESGDNARPCDFSWVMHIHDDCVAAGVPFHFKQTGANFIMNGKNFKIARPFQMPQARKARIDFSPDT
jgi:protein gp37